MDINPFFNPKVIAVIGASRDPSKVGHQLLKNIIDTNKKVYPINPNTSEILNIKSYPSILNIKEKIDLVLIAIPANLVYKTLKQCVKKKIKHIIIYSAGFKEIGNISLEKKLKSFILTNHLNVLGVNCMGTYDAYTKVDTIFNPHYKMGRPEKKGLISFVCQSGAIGATILDLMQDRNYGLSKFISYGNATGLSETDLISYLEKDNHTKVICLYIEGLEDGTKFLKIAKRIAIKKQVIVLKGGITEAGNRATISHTGSLAGSAKVYEGAFKQAKLIQATSLEQMFDIARILEKYPKAEGRRVQIITNGGGYGIMATDKVVLSGLKMADMSQKNKSILKKYFPEIVVIKNPIDLTGISKADWYKQALGTTLQDSNVDAAIVILLYQTPAIEPDVIDLMSSAIKESKKPVIFVSVGGEYTSTLIKKLELEGGICFNSPERAVEALAKALNHGNQLKRAS